MTAFVAVNPRAAGRDWRFIKEGLQNAFPLMTVAASRRRGHIAQLVRQALREGHLDIVVVGGAGSLNEAVNGFFEGGVPLSPDAVLGFVDCGRGDLGRTLGLEPGYRASLARLHRSRLRRLDVGRVRCLSRQGEPASRYFLNVASLGLTARLACREKRFTGFPGWLSAFASLIGWHPPRLRLIGDAGFDEIAGISFVAIANGRWFAGGIPIAPQADPADGKFDVAMMAGMPRGPALRALRALRGGPGPGLRLIRTSRLTVAPTLETGGKVEIETDGESAGVLPATFEILPAAINIRV